MTTSTAPPELRAALVARPQSGGRMRLSRAGQADSAVDVPVGKCAIGSSPRCQIRLPAGDAQPLQCLVQAEESQWMITRWAAGVLLNGREFSQQPLRIGDELSIGSWKLAWETVPTDGAPSSTGARETVDYQPRTTPAHARQGSEAEAETPNPVHVPRAAAKTVLVSSRQTEPLAEPLGTALPVAPPSSRSKTTVIRADLTRQLFEDRLVVSLWTSNFLARKRARALVVAARDARQRVTELSAELAAAQRQFESERAALESNASRAAELDVAIETLRKELALAANERDRVAAELNELRAAATKTALPDPRLQSLTEACATAKREAAEAAKQLAAAQQKLEDLRNACAQADSAREAAQLQAAQQASAHEKAQRQWDDERRRTQEALAQREASEQSQRKSNEEVTRLRAEVAATQAEVEVLRQQAAQADAARAAVADELAAARAQQAQWLSECRVLQTRHADELSGLVAERDELQRQLELLAAALPTFPRTERTPDAVENALPDDEIGATTPQDAEEAADISWPAMASDSETTHGQEPDDRTSAWAADFPTVEEHDSRYRRDAAVAVDPQLPAAPAREAVTEAVPTDESKPPAWRAASSDASPPVVPAAVPSPAPASTPYSSPSFIDKYRHLLEDGEDEPATESRTRSRLLDDEYLSPAQNVSNGSVDDDSDEALEAYMSNMMRRVRGDGQSTAPLPVFDATVEALASRAAEPADAAPEIELDQNGLLRLVRRQPMDTNLSALRELANTSARSAIARHRQRRRDESAASKTLICVAASASSGYLIVTAPSINSPWFWTGCVLLVIALGLCAQLVVLWRQRVTYRKSSSLAAGGDEAVTSRDFEPAPPSSTA